jgi:hypothetical protein
MLLPRTITWMQTNYMLIYIDIHNRHVQNGHPYLPPFFFIFYFFTTQGFINFSQSYETPIQSSHNAILPKS